MATHSSILAWRIPWTEDPGGLQSLGSQRVRHDWVTNASHFNMMNRLNNHLNFFLCFCFFPFALLTIGSVPVYFFINNNDKSEYSVQFSRSVMSDSLQPHELQHARPPCPSPTLGVYSNQCPSSRWCHPAITSSVVPLSSCPQSLPASGSFPMSQLFSRGGQSIGVSASASVLPMNTQDWSLLGLICWISLQSKGLSRVFSNTTVQKHQFWVLHLSKYFSMMFALLFSLKTYFYKFVWIF